MMLQIIEKIRCVDCEYHSIDYVCEHWCNAAKPRRILLDDAYKEAPCTRGRKSKNEDN